MEKCLEYVPLKSFNWHGGITIFVFTLFGIIVSPFSITLYFDTSFHCYNDKVSNSKDVESSCFRQYKDGLTFQYLCFLLVCLNFVIILISSIVYGYYVKRRVEHFDHFSPTKRNDDENEPLLGIGEETHRFTTFHSWVVYLVVRLIILLVFAVILFLARFPIDYPCSWHPTMKETFLSNHTIPTSYYATLIHCKNPNGDKGETLIQIVAGIDFFVMMLTFSELIWLLYLAIDDKIFTTDREFCLVYLMQKRERFQKSLARIIKNFDPSNVFEIHDDFGDHEICWKNLDDIYVNIIIQAKRQTRNAYPKDFERHEIFNCHLQITEDVKKLKKVTEIFMPIRAQDQRYPRSILVIGRPGIGKTMLTKKLMYEWKNSRDRFWHDKLVLLLRCRAFKNVNISLTNLLKYCDGWSHQHLLQCYNFMLLYQEKTVLIIDGLDELPFDEFLNTDGPVDVDAEMPVFTLLSMLVSHKFLKDATVLVTSRPTAERAFDRLKFDRKVEILGFFEDQIKEYVQKFNSEDKETTELILNCIDNSIELRSLCYIPVNTYIVCLTLKECFINNAEDIPKTTTELYKRAVKILFWRHHPCFRGKPLPKGYLVEDLPKELEKDMHVSKSLAKKGIEEDCLIFNDPNLSQSPQLVNCGFFHQIQDKRRNFYCFIHLTLQEFFAAWCIVDDRQNIGKFLDDHHEDPKWYMVIEFIAGLVGDTKKREKIEDISVVTNRLEKWISHLFFSEDNKALGFLGMKCLYELQDDDEMRSACKSNNFSKTISIDNVSFTPLDSNAFYEFLSKCRQLRKLKFFSCQFPDNHSVVRLSKYLTNAKACNVFSLKINSCRVNNISKHISEALKSENCKLSKLEIRKNNIGEEGAKYLSEALKNKNCELSELDIRFNKLKDQGANLLIQATKDENCKLTKLKISGNNISKQSAESFTEALKSQNCKLTELDVHFHTLSNENTNSLSKALKSENCKYTELYILENIVTAEEVKCFSETLKSENCKLIKLDISHTKIAAEGAKYLSEALKSENCKLTDLSLCHNNIGGEGAKSLSEALKSKNCKLTKLIINDNKIGDEGAESLSEALKNENCKLIELSLSGNNIGCKVAKYLSEALKSENCKLIELSLSGNNIGCKGAKYLSEALKSENCKLIELSLVFNKIGNKGAESLSEALKSENCKLIELSLSGNIIESLRVKSLSKALKN
ncbi:NACHT, LRR and PYD domains-containing protein 12-like [Xenia sp. Carnegie-2017]|uniref:NACHT, LRR and PYD domains-containing protein 12-like n=1 Tax=Xenia sp. Carnegie-2017 TaxID=2897299 RepID=UPI001F047359|nr:NACHT, LRR and PYD domains-containing protein 12-like [Xenia sp. Carnegie-2017]XP_046842189.1 NACHT, LRR and PYD domains-containing protein 12-like [Xenia sp. Carnegie-2017]